MGCISQNGCLGPRRREKEVSAELVELIYAEAERSDTEYHLSRRRCSYADIKSRVAKKGLTRKLIDHLVSHRPKAADCLTYNLRLATQTRVLSRKLAGLLIADQVTTQLYKTAKPDLLADEAKTLTRTASSQVRLTEDRAVVGTGADLRLDLAYFRLVIHLLEGERQGVSEAVLRSIANYCSGRRQRFTCRAEVWRTLELLLELVKEGKDGAAKCYLALLQLLRQGGKEESAHEGDLLIFLRLWQRQEAREPESASSQVIQTSIVRIIRLLVGRCLSGWDAKVLFRALVELYQDERVARVVRVEELVLGIVRESDLQAHILRGLFLYLFQILSSPLPDRNSRASFTEDMESLRYPHRFERNVRLRLFETLRRLGARGYISLDQCVAFGSASLVTAYTTNLRGDRDYVQEVVREFFRLTQTLSPPSNLIIIQLLLEQARVQKTQESERRLLISLAREVVQGRRLLEKAGLDFSGLLIPIQSWFGKEARMDTLQFIIFVLNHISSQQLAPQEEQTGMAVAMCELLHSVYQGGRGVFWNRRGREEQEVLGRYQYANAVISLLKCMVSKYAYLYVLCFLSAVTKRLTIDTSSNFLVLYFDLYIIYQVMHALNKRQKVPQRILTINLRIAPSARSTELKQEIQVFIKQNVGLNGQMLGQLRKQIERDLMGLREFTMVNEGELRQIEVAFQRCFKGDPPLASKQENSLDIPFLPDTSRNNQFRRESLNGSLYDSNLDRSREEDESFKDIVGRI